MPSTLSLLTPPGSIDYNAVRAKSSTQTALGVPFAPILGNGVLALAANTMLYMAYVVTSRITHDQMVLEVTTAATAGGLARLGIAKLNSDLQPTSLIVDAGAVATDSVGVKIDPVSQVLEAGIYASILNVSLACSCRFYTASTLTGLIPTLGGNANIVGFSVAQAYGAFPTTLPLWTTMIGGSTAPRHFVTYRTSAFG